MLDATIKTPVSTKQKDFRHPPATVGERKALLVIHGIGQQQPLEPLDRFVNGLRSTLAELQHRISVEHVTLGRDGLFDHCIRLTAHHEHRDQPSLHLDIYEFYWAGLCQGRISFRQVAKWLLITGFTPLKRLAFNLPLVAERVRRDGRKGGLYGGLSFEFVKEMLRMALVLVISFLVGGTALFAVLEAPAVIKGILGALDVTNLGWKQQLHVVGFLCLLAATGAVLLSLFDQVGEWRRVRKLRAELAQEQATASPMAQSPANAAPPPRTIVNAIGGRIRGGVEACAKQFNQAMKMYAESCVEVRSRSCFLVLSIMFFSGQAVILWVWSSQETIARIMDRIVGPYTTELFVGLGIILAAIWLKRILVDYIGDIAIYTSGDEDSIWFNDRLKILREATAKMRYLLQHDCYDSVGIAGHSLGSVIAYDTINWLRTEAQVTERLTEDGEGMLTADDLAKLHLLITFGSPLNKVLYFFRTKVKGYETIRAHILNELYGYRRITGPLQSDPEVVDARLELPDNVHWVNVYSPCDPVSGRLVHFRDVHEHGRWYFFWGQCHVKYWHDPVFYQVVLAALHRHGAWGKKQPSVNQPDGQASALLTAAGR